MKKIKALIIGLVMIGTVVVAGIASAAQTSVTVTFDVDAVTGISTCTGNLPIGSFTTIDQGHVSSPCNIVAYSNDPDGFTVALNGTNDGLDDPTHTYEWDKLSTSTADMDTSCTSSCTTAWGFRIGTGTAAEYDVVETGNGGKAFDAETCGGGSDKCWHTVNYFDTGIPNGAETIITNSSPTADDTANFDVEIGAVMGFMPNGTYTDTITLTITPQ